MKRPGKRNTHLHLFSGQGRVARINDDECSRELKIDCLLQYLRFSFTRTFCCRFLFTCITRNLPSASTGLVPSLETPTKQITRRLMPASPCIDTGSAQRRWGCVSSSPRQKFSSFNIQPIWPKITGNSQNSSWSTAQFS